MTTLLDTEFQALALEMLEEFATRADGTIATRTWTHLNSTVATPSAGTATRSTTNYSVTTTPPMAFDPASMRTAKQFEPSELTTSGEMYLGVAASGLAFVPAAGDTVLIGSDTWSVVGVQPVYSGELVAFYSARILK